MFRIAAAAFLAAILAQPASAFMARNDLIVTPTAEGRFEVPYRGLSGASDFWCAAGDYVVRELGLPADTEIFRVSAPPRRSGQGIAFGLSPEGATATGLALLSGGPGVTAAHARQLCEVPRLFAD